MFLKWKQHNSERCKNNCHRGSEQPTARRVFSGLHITAGLWCHGEKSQGTPLQGHLQEHESAEHAVTTKTVHVRERAWVVRRPRPGWARRMVRLHMRQQGWRCMRWPATQARARIDVVSSYSTIDRFHNPQEDSLKERGEKKTRKKWRQTRSREWKLLTRNITALCRSTRSEMTQLE